MTSAMTRPAHRPDQRPGSAVIVVGALTILWCLGFAAVNVAFEATDHFAGSSLAAYTSGLAVMDWLVTGLKLLGAAVAFLSLVRRPVVVSPGVLTVLLWGAFTTLGGYGLGSVFEAIGMVTGLRGSVDEISVRGVVYVLMFLAAAAGYGLLAVSHLRRYGQPKALAVAGVLGAPVLLGLVLLAVPTMLALLGLLPVS